MNTLSQAHSARSGRGARSKAGLEFWRCRAAFTLVEMLVVMAVVVIILSLLRPVIRNMASGNPVTNGVDVISGFLAGARNLAIAQNTYVVVGFSQDPNNSDGLLLAGVRSLNDSFGPNQVYDFSSGTNTYGTNPSLQITYRSIGPVVHLNNLTLQTYANLLPSLQAKMQAANVPPSSSNSSTTSADFIDCSTKPTPPGTSAMSFVIQVGTQSQLFNWCLIAFTPQGEALYFPTFPATNSSTTPFYSQLFIGLNTSRGGTAVANDYSGAGIVLDGGAGNIRAFRL